MRTSILLLSLFLVMFVSSGCTETHDGDDGSYTYRVRDNAEDSNDDLDDAMDAVGDEISEAGERLREHIDDQLDDIDENAGDEIETTIASIGEALEKVGKALQNDSDIQPVDHRKLRDLLPDAIDGMERVNTDGSRKSALGIRISKVEAEYDGMRKNLDIEIVDLGSLSGAAVAGLDFLDAEIDHENDHGFERTTRFGGYPGFVQVEGEGSSQHYSAVVMVNERFVVKVEANGRNLDEDILEQTFDKIDLSRLEHLAR